MALILNIDTSSNYASVCISRNGEVLAFTGSNEQKEHASFLHVAIAQLSGQCGVALSQLDAVAVTSGPGSYTGLRVGMASAKGICYALNKPLIAINTLLVMASSVLSAQEVKTVGESKFLLCPMIDARRMEVFTAIYTQGLEVVLQPTALTLDALFFENYLAGQPVIFFGSGSEKFRAMLNHRSAQFFENQSSAADLAVLAQEAFGRQNFADLAYAEPFYAKEFYSTQPIKKTS